MSETVTIDLYSGIPNPSWVLTDAQSRVWRARLTALTPAIVPADYRPRKTGFKGITVRSWEPSTGAALGYRVTNGLTFATGRAREVLSDPDRQVQRWLFDTAPQEILETHGLTYEALTKPPTGFPPIDGIGGITAVGGLICTSGPVYTGDVVPWAKKNPNDPWEINENNCYTYSNNVPILKPGGLPGLKATSTPLTTALMLEALAQDGLSIAQPGDVLPASCPVAAPGKEAHYIAVCWRQQQGLMRDFHCLRLDRAGRWSQKDGTGPVNDSDDAHVPLDDLRAARFEYPMTLIGFFASIEGKRQID